MPGRYRKDSWMDQFNEPSKYTGLFEITVPVEGRLLQAQVRPSDDKTFYTVTLNRTFFGHLVKDVVGWKDVSGNRSETIELIGRMIYEKLKFQ